jgi:hypothetical protein
MPTDPKCVQAVFLAAVEQPDPAGRAAVLDRECLADSELRLRVEALLETHGQINDSLKQPRVGSDDRDKPWLA